MKTIHSSVFLLVALSLAAGFSGCGNDSEIESDKVNNQGGVIIPEAKITPPSAKWVGSSNEYEVIFMERESGDPENALDFPRIFVRSADTPYTGSINRVYLSGAFEFKGGYQNGFLEGLARQWESDGTLASSVHVKGGNIVKSENLEQTGSVAPRLEPSQENTIVPSAPIFVGDNKNLATWTTITVEEGVEYLLDKRTGKKVTGGLQVQDDNGGKSYYSEYRDGKLHGRNDNWHNNGVKSIESSYLGGLKHGVETWRDEHTGLKTWEANYLNGKLHGIETTWDENGTVLSQRSYQNGELIPPNE